MQKNKLVLLISIIILLAGAGLAYYIAMPGEKKAPPKKPLPVKYVSLTEVNYSNYPVILEVTGRVRAFNKIDVFAEVQGIYTPDKKLFKEGVEFKKGERFVHIDDREAKLNLKSQKSEFLNLLTTLMVDIKTDFPNSFKKWNSYLNSIDIDNDLPELPKVDTEKEKYFISSRNIFTTYYNIKNAEVRLSKYKLSAPFTGTVTQSMINPGTLIRPGAKIGEFAGESTYEIVAGIRIADLSFVEEGQKVLIEMGKDTLAGFISRISDNIDTGTQTVNAYISVSSKKLKDGMYVNCIIDGAKVENVFKIDRSALVDNKEIYTVKDSTLDKSPIELIYLGKSYAYIQGIDAGTTVVNESLSNVKLGIKIRDKGQE